MNIVQTAFIVGVLAEEATWQVVVLIPKGVGNYCGIGLMEVVWKVIVVIINCLITASITYHDFLHGFRAGRGMGTATLEVRLIHQITAMREEVLCTIFMNLHKAYDALDRYRCLDILEGYGIGPRALHLLRRYWERIQMMARAGGTTDNPSAGREV